MSMREHHRLHKPEGNSRKAEKATGKEIIPKFMYRHNLVSRVPVNHMPGPTYWIQISRSSLGGFDIVLW